MSEKKEYQGTTIDLFALQTEKNFYLRIGLAAVFLLLFFSLIMNLAGIFIIKSIANKPFPYVKMVLPSGLVSYSEVFQELPENVVSQLSKIFIYTHFNYTPRTFEDAFKNSLVYCSPETRIKLKDIYRNLKSKVEYNNLQSFCMPEKVEIKKIDKDTYKAIVEGDFRIKYINKGVKNIELKLKKIGITEAENPFGIYVISMKIHKKGENNE